MTFMQAVKDLRAADRAQRPDLMAESRERLETAAAELVAMDHEARTEIARRDVPDTAPPPEIVALRPHRLHGCGALVAADSAAGACWHCGQPIGPTETELGEGGDDGCL